MLHPTHFIIALIASSIWLTGSATPQAPSDPEYAERQLSNNVAGDPGLVGIWVYQTTGPVPTEQLLELRADGSYSYVDVNTASGGVVWSYNGGRGSGETDRGIWRAEGGILHMRAEAEPWAPVGEYRLADDGQTMRITYDGGRKKRWSRLSHH